jgi:antitoxin (DNA-binding transcriptional repressor) of toxin-antitoxin stability system
MSKHWAGIRGGQERKGAKMTHTCAMIVAKGEKIMITKNGVPMATLQPADSAKRIPVS